MLRTFVAQHMVTLGYVSFGAGLISLVFGGTLLGRIPHLSDRNGLYRRFLVSIPTGLLLGFFYYAFDARIGFLDTQIINSVFTTNFSPIAISVVLGFLSFLVPMVYPDAMRGDILSGSPTDEQINAPSSISWGSLAGILLLTIVLFTATSLINIQIIYKKLHFFSGHQPSVILTAIIAGILITSAFFLMGVGQYFLRNKAIAEERRSATLGCSFTGAGCLLEIIALIVPGILVGYYLVTRTGWSVILFSIFSLVLSAFLRLLQRGVDAMDTRVVGGIFATLAAVAAILQFTISNASHIPI